MILCAVVINVLATATIYLQWSANDKKPDQRTTPPTRKAQAKLPPVSKPSVIGASSSSPSPAEERKAQRELELQRQKEWIAAVLPSKAETGKRSTKSPAKSAPAAKRAESPAPAQSTTTTTTTTTTAASSKASPGAGAAVGGGSDAKFELGQTVTVAYRSVVGEPVRPGGEAKVTAVTKASKGKWVYNVAYYLGGREIGVEEKHLSTESSLTNTDSKKRSRTPLRGNGMVAEASSVPTPGKKKR